MNDTDLSLRFSAEETALLESSLDSATIIQTRVKPAAAVVADLCVVPMRRLNGLITFEALEHINPAPREAAAGVAEPEAAPELRCRVLVVDDNIDAAETLAEIVSIWGHDVVTAHDGPRALSAVAELRPDVVLLDIGLPLMDGYEVVRALRADARCDGMKIFAITGYGQEDDRTRARAAGFDQHFVKPVSLEALEEAIRWDRSKDPASLAPA